MEQRRLRLGDILDDYCPRERRLTNHAVVAMIEENVKQTRCTTCDAEHVYKGGKVPRRKKKDAPDALYRDVLAGMPDDAPPVLAVPLADAPTSEAEVEEEPAEAEPADVEPIGQDVEDGPVHRQLIRAQLPRIEGHKEERRLPDFTIRQAGRGAPGFRGGDTRMKPQADGNGGNSHRSSGAHRFAGPRPGAPGRSQPGRSGPAAGFRGSGQPRPGGPRKRSR